MDAKVVVVRGVEVVLDPSRLTFNEANLSRYLQEEAAWYNFISQNLADAETEKQIKELHYETKYSDKFKFYKEQGGSDKLAESNANADVEVVAHKQAVLEAINKVKSLQYYLKALDKSHENAQSFGHMLRKEMDKLYTDIKKSTDTDFEAKIDKIFGT